MCFFRLIGAITFPKKWPILAPVQNVDCLKIRRSEIPPPDYGRSDIKHDISELNIVNQQEAEFDPAKR